MTRWIKCRVLFPAVACLVLMGCQGALLTYVGTKVQTGSLVPLTDGMQESGRYRSTNLNIDYQVSRSGNELQLSGTAEYAPGVRHAYNQIPYFHLSLFLADRNGRILEDRGIMTPGSDDPTSKMRLRERIKLPPGTAYMAFGYNGEGRSSSEGLEGGDGDSPFWEIPIIR